MKKPLVDFQNAKTKVTLLADAQQQQLKGGDIVVEDLIDGV
ncbi:MAG: hypothetical protein AAFW73_18125 [Bacteroidota bacterium]